KVKLRCEYCERSFELLKSVRRARERDGRKIKYCSKKCEGKAKRTRIIVRCINCDNEFETTRNKYCSRKCTTEHMKNSGALKRKGYWYENGYKVLYTGNGQGVKKHRKIMEEHLGRKLKSNEVVHHING